MKEVKIGSVVKVEHPVTCLNPDEWFTVIDIRYWPVTKSCSVRGKDTAWFGASLIVAVK